MILQLAFQFSLHKLGNVCLNRFENILKYLLPTKFYLPFPSWWKQNGLEFELEEYSLPWENLRTGGNMHPVLDSGQSPSEKEIWWQLTMNELKLQKMMHPEVPCELGSSEHKYCREPELGAKSRPNNCS